MDLEQSLANGKIDVAASDMFRVIMMQNKGKNIKFLASSCREWQLFVNKKRRITKAEQLGDRMIGMTRCSVLDYYCDTISSKIKRNSGLLLKPQINDIFIRQQMLDEAQIDAAFIPLPHNQVSIQKGHNIINSLPYYDGYAGFAINTKRIAPDSPEINLLLKAYNMAIDSIKANPKREIPQEILSHFKLDTISLQMIKSKSLSHIYRPNKKTIESALYWSKKNHFASTVYKTDTLIYAH